MPCDETLLEPLGRVNWAAARLHHGVRDAIGLASGEHSDGPFNATLGSAVKDLRKLATQCDRLDLVEWCDGAGTAAVEARNGVTHAIGFTAPDGRQALRGSTALRPHRYLAEGILDVADQLVEAALSLAAVGNSAS